MLGRPVHVEAAAVAALAPQRHPILPDRAAGIEILDQAVGDELAGPGRIDVPTPDPEIELAEFGRGAGGRGAGRARVGAGAVWDPAGKDRHSASAAQADRMDELMRRLPVSIYRSWS